MLERQGRWREAVAAYEAVLRGYESLRLERVREISAATSGRPVELLLCDFASQRSIRTAAAEGAEFDAMMHESESGKMFGKISNEEGLKAALAWRDGPFKDGRGAR